MERNIVSLRTSYNTDNGIDFAANEVQTSMNNFLGTNVNNPQNMGIGHSMGGLMIRNVAIVANITTSFLCNIIINNDMIQNMMGNPITNNDLRTTSPIVQALRTHTDNSNIPRISIWAQESSPVHWRMFSSQIHGNDQKLVDDVNDARNIYNGFYVYNTTLAISTAIAGFFNPTFWTQTATSTYKAVQWKKGRDWIDDSENIWNSLIKSTRIEEQTYWLEVWVMCDGPVEFSAEEGVSNCGHWEWRQFTRNVSVNYPSDGLLPQYTQELNNIPFINKYYVPNANHIEVRNMTRDGNGIDETAEEFRKIFNRGIDDWFTTPVR